MNLPNDDAHADGLWLIPVEATALAGAVWTPQTTPATLGQLQGLVGGYIELIAFKHLQGWCDEEGKLKGADINPVATALWWACGGPRKDVLCGPIVICVGRAAAD